MTSPLAFGLDFADLYRHEGLLRLDAAFLAWLQTRDPLLAATLAQARTDGPPADALAHSRLLLALAAPLEDFVAELFGVRAALDVLVDAQKALDPFFEFKKKFVQRKAVRFGTPEEAETLDGPALQAALALPVFDAAHDASVAAFEDDFVASVTAWQAAGDEARVEQARLYAVWAALSDAGRVQHRYGVLFRVPRGVDPDDRVPAARATGPAGRRVFTIRPELETRREGFGLTDGGASLRHALHETRYCLICHEQGVDSCSKGLKHDQKAPGAGRAAFKVSPEGQALTGCPLEERISEFHALKRDGRPLAALAMIALDNPLCAATGHRICNDCVKACVFQQQTPVDIPQTETRTLHDVLGLPWGVEIYSLLTRWNPLNLARWLPAAPTGRRVLVVGMGPAGFTLAHHLLNAGHTVVGIEGLRVEPLPQALSGLAPDGRRTNFTPVASFEDLREPLEHRAAGGFGGVAEYGITNRWDKNFLTLLRLLLERREGFALHGGVRFGAGDSGGTLTPEDAWARGFDHVALALGAGEPVLPAVPGLMARGVRAASDFLMTLQSGGAARADSIANLQLRLPVVVVGGGLTAIDTATEALAYYPVQVEKFARRHATLVEAHGEEAVRTGWGDEEAAIADEFLAHAAAIAAERERARAAGDAPRVRELLLQWGGATIAYRRRLQDSPAWALSHDEIEHALAEGVRFAEGLSPRELELDAHGALQALIVTDTDGATHRLPARALFIAAGTRPNTVLAEEDPEGFVLEGRHFRLLDAPPPEAGVAKPERVDVLVRREPDGRAISQFGDLHPAFGGNVVRAMASATRGAPVIDAVLRVRAPASPQSCPEFLAAVRRDLTASVLTVRRLAPGIVELVVQAPAAARQFKPGQFYRLQTFAAHAPRVQGTLLQMEPLALTGAWTDAQRGLVGMIVLEMGGSSDLVAGLRAGEPVSLMGPTGTPTDIPAGRTVLLAGGGLGNAVLFSIGAALRAAGSRVLYFAGYRRAADRFRTEDIEAAADQVVWCCDEAAPLVTNRPQDRAFAGNIVDAMRAWGEGRFPGGLPENAIRLQEVDRVIAIGSDRMMAAVAAARHGVLAPFLEPGHAAVASVNSPMQCMLKRICAQCLQRQVDPATGTERWVFSCSRQDQDMDAVDFTHLSQRLRQDAVQEKLTARWLERVRPRH